MGEFSFAVHQLFDDAEAVEAGHLDVEENEIGRMFFDESESFDAVLALADEMHLGKTLEEEGEFVAGGFFVVHNECVDRHDAQWTWAWPVYANGRLAFNLEAKAEELLTRRSQRAQRRDERREIS